MIAVFRKELRDCLRWTPLGMVLGLVMLWMGLPNGVYDATAMEFTLLSQLGLAASLIAIALGLLQSLSDTRNDSRGYLLHRPIRPSKLYWAKVAAGYVAYMISLAVPVVVAMIYLQTKGIEKLPTNALQVVPFLLYSSVVFLLHPTVLWIANRDARWVGTRLLPAIGAITIIYHGNLFFTIEHYYFYLMISMSFAIILALALVTLLGARHAFVHQSKLPARSYANWASVPCMIGLVFSALVVYGAVFWFITSMIPTEPQEYHTYQISMNDQGQWQQLHAKRNFQNWNDAELRTREIDAKGEFEKVDKDWKESHGSRLSLHNIGTHANPLQQFNYLGTSTSKTAKHGQVVIVGHRGRVLLYDGSKKLISIITPSGSYRDWNEATGNFTELSSLAQLHGSGGFTKDSPNLQTSSNPLLIGDSGVYQLTADDRRMELLSNDGNVVGAMLLLADENVSASLWTLTDSKLTKHELAALDKSIKMPHVGAEAIKATNQIELPPIKVLNSQSWEISKLNEYETLRVQRTAAGKYAIVRGDSLTNLSQYAMLGDNGSVEVLGSVQLPAPVASPDMWSGWGSPPLLFGFSALMSLIIGASVAPWSLALILMILCHGVLAASVTWWLAGRYRLSNRERITWSVVGLLLGLGSLIGFISIYRKPIMDECPRCNEARRVDLESCEHCDQLWEPPLEEGIEIFERDESFDRLEEPSLS